MDMQSAVNRCVDEARLARLALELVEIPSPTLHNHDVAEAFALALEEVGLEVERHTPFAESIVVVGRLKGGGDGPTLEFNGHLDHVPVPHGSPRIEDGKLIGRGSADMKGSLASVVEALRAIKEAGIRLKGDVLVTAQGLHEAPGTYEHSEDRQVLIERGIHGDACVVVEGPADELVVRFGGLTIFDVVISRRGEVSHEIQTPKGTPNPLLLGAHLACRMEERNQELVREEIELLGPDSYHVGILGGGDYFNRFATHCKVEGTRRNHPGWGYDECLEELKAIVDEVVRGTGVQADVRLKNTRNPGEIAPNHPLVGAFQEAHERTEGHRLPLAGMRLAVDVPLFLDSEIPAICYGPRGVGAHADLEWVPLSELSRCARLWAAIACEYCGVESS